MSAIFTDYVRSLTTTGGPPNESVFDRVLDALRGVLIHELKKRSLWTAPPSYLGLTGATRWSDGNVLEELLYDAYAFIFVQRLASLAKHAETRRSIDGLIFLNVRHFLHEAQKRHDPVGFRAFEVLHGALVQLIEEGTLHVLDGDPRVRSDTVLGPSPGVIPFPRRPAAAEEETAENPWPARIAVWCNDLLPALVTAWNRDEAVAPLAGKIRELARRESAPFAFSDLMEPLKEEVRRRWRAVAMHEEGELGIELDEDEEGVTQIVPLVWPSNDFEERQSFVRLVECVEEGIERRSEKPRTRSYLRRLWLYFHQWAAPARPGKEDEAPGSATATRLPSTRQLSDVLSIPRERFQDLRGKLGELVKRCHDAARVGPMRPSAPPAQQPVPQEGGQAMNARDQRERLLRMTGEAAARVVAAREPRERDEGEPRPGDVYVISGPSAGPATAPGEDLPVEWVILERDSQAAGRYRLVPADDRPWRGPHDVTAHGADGARSRLRCGVEAWVAPAVLEAGTRVGSVPPEIVEEARQRADAVALAEWEDPEMADWHARLAVAAESLADRAMTAVDPEPLEPAIEAVEDGEIEEKKKQMKAFRPERWRALGLAASVLLAMAVFLVISWQRIGDLQRSNTQAALRIAEFEQALADPDLPWADVLPDELVRGDETPVLELRPESLIALMRFDVLAADHPLYRLRFIETASGREIHSVELTARAGTLRLLVRREIFPREGEIRVLLDGITAGGEIVPLEDTYTFKVEFVEDGAP